MQRKQFLALMVAAMRVSFYQIFFSILFTTAAYAFDARGQNVLDRHVSLSVTNMEIRKILSEIQQQTGVKFVYSSKAIDAGRRLTLNVNDRKIGEVLSEFFRPLQIAHKVINNQILLFRTAAEPGTVLSNPPPAPKPVVITGRVVGESLQPLAGVSIMAGTGGLGATTDVQGSFHLQVAESPVTLVISAVGYESQEITVKQATPQVINLKAVNKTLEDLLVIGYGTARKKDVTSAIVSVTAKDIANQPVAGFDQALVGKAAGVRIAAITGAPGAGQSVLIRGIGSINASAAPLYVIDGMPLPESFDKTENPLNAVNPNDIASIDILKDASSSAIYGARASNGVVLITTKRGRRGRPALSFSTYQGLQGMQRTVKMLGRDDFLQYLRDARSQAYVIQDPYLWNDQLRSYTWDTPDDVRLANLYAHNSEGIRGDKRIERWFTLSDTLLQDRDDVNWMEEITRKAHVQNYELSATGGSESVSYMLSGNYFNQQGIVKNSGYQRFGARANVDLKISDRLKMGLNVAPSYEVFNKLDRMESNDGPNGLFGTALVMPPVYAPYDRNGNIAYLGTVVNGPYDFDIAGLINPYSLLQIKSNGYNTRTIASLFAEWRLAKKLTFRSELNTEFRNRIGEYFSPATVPTATTPGSRSVGISENLNRSYLNTQNIFTYAATVDKHSITAMLGYQAEKTTHKTDFLRKYDFFGNDLSSLNNSGTIDNPLQDVRTNRSASAMIGSFGRLQYHYAGRYYLTASLRRDGSSKFGRSNRWGYFPSFSAAWRMTDEGFARSFPHFINDIKIRGGWGRVGNSSIADYLALNRLGNADYNFGGSSPQLAVGTYDLGIAYPKLGWESTEDFDLGADILLFKGRVGLTYDFFLRKTRNMLYNVALVGQTGFTNQIRNISAMQNKGMEFALNSRNLVGAFKWSTQVNLSFVRNKVLDLGPQKNPLIGIDTRTEEGKPISNIYGYVYLGPYRNWEEVKTSPIIIGGNTITRSVPGDARYADVNRDGLIDANDQTIIGNPQPDFVYGVSNHFSYKQFDMGIQVNGVQGGDINLRSFRREVFGGNSGRVNIPQFYFDNYWRPDRTDAKYEAPNRKSYTKQYLTSTQNVEKGTFLNISNINVGYTVPAAMLSRLKLTAFRVYLVVQNALLMTRYHGFNPESNVAGIDAKTQGTDELGYPLARTVALGLNLNF